MINKSKIRVGISQGDINGISYEVIIKTLQDNRINELASIIVYGSPKVAAYHRKALDINNFSFNNIRTPDEANQKRPNIINCLDDEVRVELGKSTQIAGDASLVSLQRAVQDLKNGKLHVLVTAPINKDNIQSPDFNFPGHTEYLEAEFKAEIGTLMIMVSDRFKVAVLTGHVPLSQVAELVTKELVLTKLRLLNESLKVDFGIRKPNIAVLGLNPHAGDNGFLGQEEKEIIEPAIAEARNEGILAIGTFPADGFFGSASQFKFDAVLAMYHDQGLAPFKSIVTNGVNYTAGLSIVRTSPAHGTGFDIAGKGLSSPDSFRNALFLALDILKQRRNYKELTEDPLQIKGHRNGR